MALEPSTITLVKLERLSAAAFRHSQTLAALGTRRPAFANQARIAGLQRQLARNAVIRLKLDNQPELTRAVPVSGDAYNDPLTRSNANQLHLA